MTREEKLERRKRRKVVLAKLREVAKDLAGVYGKAGRFDEAEAWQEVFDVLST